MTLRIFMCLLLTAGVPSLAIAAEDSNGTPAHSHSMESAALDDRGRRFYDMQHQVTEENAAELRQRVEQFAPVDTATIQTVMDRMGPNYEWYISDLDLRGETGVLVLAHGFRTAGDNIFRQRLNPLAAQQPTALALGMSMMMSDHIQFAINDLEAAGAKRIVVVPVVSNRYNSLMRQWQYIFGLIDDPAYIAVAPVTSNVPLLFGEPPEDDPLIVDTLADYAREVSRQPDNEFLLLVAHGPESAADNEVVLTLLQKQVDEVQARLNFADVAVASLQDDAPKAVRAANVEQMRALVKAAQDKGYEVLVITNLLGARTVQAELRRDLRGLRYTFNAKGIMQHDNFVRWIEQSVAEAVETR